jgi:uncharacterized protein YbjT (DUF2867 family)
MTVEQTVLLLGGTGRTGRRVLEQLLSRDANVRAIVRSAERLPAGVAKNPRLTVVEADLLSLSDAELRGHVRGCDVVISCLGHVMSLRGVFGPPRDLVTQATTRLCKASEAVRPATPIKFILMSSVSVNRPGLLDARRGVFERAFVATIRGLLPPAMDNQRAADFLCSNIGADNPFVQWAAVRPDTLLDGDVSEYAMHEGLVSSLFRPDSTNMANVAHSMCELATDPKAWDRWKGKLP